MLRFAENRIRTYDEIALKNHNQPFFYVQNDQCKARALTYLTPKSPDGAVSRRWPQNNRTKQGLVLSLIVFPSLAVFFPQTFVNASEYEYSIRQIISRLAGELLSHRSAPVNLFNGRRGRS